MHEHASMSEQVMAANVAFYREIAKKYDQYESCASDEYFRRMLENDINIMQSRLLRKRVRCLDCGGGSGNLTLKMLARGWSVTVVDVSPEMLRISRAKVRSCGYKVEFVNDSIEHFLASSDETFDVISFSSVLHHIFSPLDVVKEVAARVRHGGFFYSNFDPVFPSSPFLANCFYNADTAIAKILHDRKDLLPGLGRRVKKLFLEQDAAHGRPIANPGDLAEYHAREGIDDLSIERALVEQGFIVERERYPVARTKLMRWTNRWLRAFLNFKVTAQRKDPARSWVPRCSEEP